MSAGGNRASRRKFAKMTKTPMEKGVEEERVVLKEVYFKGTRTSKKTGKTYKTLEKMWVNDKENINIIK